MCQLGKHQRHFQSLQFLHVHFPHGFKTCLFDNSLIEDIHALLPATQQQPKSKNEKKKKYKPKCLVKRLEKVKMNIQSLITK